MALPVWMPGTTDDEFLEVLSEEIGPDVELETREEPGALPEARVLVRGVPSARQLDECRNLERVIVPYAGVPAQTLALLAERPSVGLHNLHHNAAPTAELAIALMLAARKRVVPHDRDLRRGNWTRRYDPPESVTLEGSHALVLGYGAIGRRVARACLGLRMTVSAIRRTAGPSDESEPVTVYGLEDLDLQLGYAEVLFLCLPLTAETRGILGSARLALLPSGACLVNVGRGELVDEGALFEALRDRRLDCAGLDVWYRYPKERAQRSSTAPSAHPFRELENVVMSPHRAGLTVENEPLRARHLAALLNAAAAGAEVPNRVDVARGY